MPVFLVRIAAKKIIMRLTILLVARIAALNLDAYGIRLNPDIATGAILAQLELLRNYIKVKYDLPWL